MPIQAEEKASEKPAAKARPMLKRHQQVIGTLLLWNTDNGLTLKYRNPRILIVFKCQNSLLDCFDTVNEFVEKKMEESIMTKLLKNVRKSYQTIQDVGQTKCCSNSTLLRIGHLKMDISSGERWRTEEKLSILLETDPFSEIPVPSTNPRTFRKYNHSCIARQCTVTRRFYRVLYLSRRKTEKELRSIVNHGLISGRVSLKTGRHTVFFTAVNPMDNQDGLGETLCDSSQARIWPYKNTWKHVQDTVFWCNLKFAQQRGLHFYQTRSNADIFYDTLPAEFIEKEISSRGPKHGQSERQIMFFTAKEMLKKARQPKHGVPSDDSRKMVCIRRIPRFVGGAQYWRQRNHALRSHRSWTTWLYKYTSWMITERQTLGSSFECWWAPETSSTATRFCRGMKKQCLKMQDAHLAETQHSLIPIRPQHQQTASTTKSEIRRRRKLRSLCRSQDWMAVLQRATGKPAGSIFIFIFNFAAADFAMANELELMATWRDFFPFGPCFQFSFGMIPQVSQSFTESQVRCWLQQAWWSQSLANLLSRTSKGPIYISALSAKRFSQQELGCFCTKPRYIVTRVRQLCISKATNVHFASLFSLQRSPRMITTAAIFRLQLLPLHCGRDVWLAPWWCHPIDHRLENCPLDLKRDVLGLPQTCVYVNTGVNYHHSLLDHCACSSLHFQPASKVPDRQRETSWS